MLDYSVGLAVYVQCNCSRRGPILVVFTGLVATSCCFVLQAAVDWVLGTTFAITLPQEVALQGKARATAAMVGDRAKRWCRRAGGICQRNM